MPNLSTVVANVVLRVALRQLLKQLLGSLEVLLDEYFGVVVCTFSSLFAIAIHVVPAKLANDVFKFAHLSMETETHVEIGTTLVHVTIGAMLPLLTLLLHKVRTNLKIVTEVALISISALTHTLKFVARLDFTLIMRMGAIVREPAFAMDELFANTVGSKFVVVGRGRRLLVEVERLLVQVIEVTRVCTLGGLLVHIYKYSKQVEIKNKSCPPISFKDKLSQDISKKNLS